MRVDSFFVLEMVNHPKFPYRLTIRQGDKILLALRVQDLWPGQRGHIFCMREAGRDWPPPEAEIERVPIVSLKRLGKRLALVLNRSRRKRCDFLFLKKHYKGKEGQYEQIFWRTSQALRARKLRVKLSTYYSAKLSIIVDVNERYPWRFAGHEVERRGLPVGDYALKEGDNLLAVVERKTFENLLAEFARMALFHQQLYEPSTYSHAALVIEAAYSDFLKPERLPAYTPSFCARAIAELYALHPGLTIVFAGNRRLAREWTLRFFEAVKSHQEDRFQEGIFQGREELSFKVRTTILEELPSIFTARMIRGKFPEASPQTISRILQELKKKGFILPQGRGLKSFWKKK